MFLYTNKTFDYWIRRYHNAAIYLLIAATLISCAHVSPNIEKGRLTNSAATSDLVTFASNIVLMIRDRKLNELAKYIHPVKGLSFSPYGYVANEHITITNEELPTIWQSDPVMNWGHYDGSGKPIKISISDYFNTFVYAADYATAPLITEHSQLDQGNNYRNIQDVFPTSTFLEYRFKGFDPKFQGMDWRSLILVFENHQDNGWWLIAIINDQWTI